MGNLEFNVEENEQDNNYEVLPKGNYEAIISATQVKNTKSGTGKFLAVEFTIFEEGFEGRKVFANFNVKNDSEKAQKIGLGQLSSLCKACGKTGIVDDSSELHDVPLIIKVDVGEYNNQAKNEVKGYLPKVGAVTDKSVPAAKFDESDIPF